jgi:F0F1-type ATP synthase epsilon subunit
MADGFHFVIRTPREAAFDDTVRGVRMSAETGQFGIRPGAEPMMLEVNAGLIVIRQDGGTRFAATAGGLLESDRQRCVLYTPFAVLGEQDADVLAGLDQALSTQNGELEARRRLGELEQHILREIRHRHRITRAARP